MSTSPSPTAKNPVVEALGKQIQLFANDYATWRLTMYAKWLTTEQNILLYGRSVDVRNDKTEAKTLAQFEKFTAEYKAIHSHITELVTNQRSDEPCVWRRGDDGYWHGPCGAAWRFDDGDTSPAALVNFCPECGHLLAIVAEEAQP